MRLIGPIRRIRYVDCQYLSMLLSYPWNKKTVLADGLIRPQIVFVQSVLLLGKILLMMARLVHAFQLKSVALLLRHSAWIFLTFSQSSQDFLISNFKFCKEYVHNSKCNFSVNNLRQV